jgi:hypothetical protein
MRFLILCFTLAILVTAGMAQTTPVSSTPAGFVVASDVLAINCVKGWGVGNLTTESYDLIDFGATKSNRVFGQGVQLLAPSCGLSIYGAGVLVQPDLSLLLKKTNIPVGNLITFFDASAGNGLPSVGNNHVSVVLGGGLKYILSDNITWSTVRFEEVFFGSNRYPSVSTGLALYFGGTPASASVSPAVKKSLIKKMATVARLTQ